MHLVETAAMELHDVNLLLTVSILSAWQNIYFARKVSIIRNKHNIRHVSTTGHVEFETIYYANQNLQQYYSTFLVLLWGAGVLTSQVWAASIGLLYLFARQRYFKGYLGPATCRTPGYFFAKRTMTTLSGLVAIGLFNAFVKHFFGVEFDNYIANVAQVAPAVLLFI
uniref:Arachidonate 5-lipoxygenase-activating protein n=1 Tax=Eptatretus burgeri TaxID=7764 RepID=A0A8C4QE23_EPTBU